MNGGGGKKGGEDERTREDRWNNGQMNRCREKRKKNTGADENRVGPTIGSGSFKMTVIRCWLWAHKSPVKRTFPNVSHPIKASKRVQKS